MNELDKQLSTLTGIATWARESAVKGRSVELMQATWLQIAETCEVQEETQRAMVGCVDQYKRDLEQAKFALASARTRLLGQIDHSVALSRLLSMIQRAVLGQDVGAITEDDRRHAPHHAALADDTLTAVRALRAGEGPSTPDDFDDRVAEVRRLTEIALSIGAGAVSANLARDLLAALDRQREEITELVEQVAIGHRVAKEAINGEIDKDAEIARLTKEREEARKFGEIASSEFHKLAKESMEVTCAFCGMNYPRGTPRHGDGALAEHIKVCPKHPMREAEAALATARAEALEEAAKIAETRKHTDGWGGAIAAVIRAEAEKGT